MDVNTVCVARNDFVVLDQYFVLRPSLDHDTARLKMLKVAVFDVHVGVDRHQPGSARIVRSITFQLAFVRHFDTGAF